ncbi:thermonuclease family protein [Caldimonas tepidiphila]|uniref:thermonuclease family protein n=1 Tax=Caldimonas tepidiphila TaxID=2315841 RepID=UPI000E5AD2EA|nr:thermonuclease family protein [Caldimonas tepidiphila]
MASVAAGIAGRARRAAAPVLLLLCAVGGATPAQPPQLPSRWAGTVTGVSDGDTLWVRPDPPSGQAPVKLRLIGIDAPERCQDGGREAGEALAARVLRARVQVEALGLDGWGRVLARVLHGEERGPPGPAADVGAWLVSEGHAWNDRLHGGDGGLYAAQEQAARSAGRGLFADAAAVPPWRFRRAHGPCD